MLKTALRHEILPRLLVLWTKRGAIVGLVFGCAYGTAIPFVGNIVGAALGVLPGAALGLSTGALGGTAAALLFHQAGTRWVGDFGVSLFALLPRDRRRSPTGRHHLNLDGFCTAKVQKPSQNAQR